MTTKERVKLSAIIFDEGLYPRVEGHDPATVQIYARDMEQIELAGRFMSVNANNILLDGKHRMLAYKKNAEGKTDFEVTVFKYPVESHLESFKLACELQDKGKTLSNDDRVGSAKKLYSFGMAQKDIAESLSVSASTVSQWLSRTVKEEKERKKAKVFEMWLACYTQEEISEAVEIPRDTIQTWVSGTDKSKGFVETLADEESTKWSDFNPPIYNVWKQQTKSEGAKHFGNSEKRWLENLLYLYTTPASIIVDPFAGSGSTIDVCKKRGRRYYVSDRKPIVEREHEIRKHDVTDGLPAIPRWKDVSLVYLDPPYWKQAEGQYSKDPEDFANMTLDQFNTHLASLITSFSKKLTSAYIALIIQPTQWKAPGRCFVDHVGDMLRAVKLDVDMRYSVPYESQQCNAQMVKWAKEQKKCLVLSREIIVWKV